MGTYLQPQWREIYGLDGNILGGGEKKVTATQFDFILMYIQKISQPLRYRLQNPSVHSVKRQLQLLHVFQSEI